MKRLCDVEKTKPALKRSRTILNYDSWNDFQSDLDRKQKLQNIQILKWNRMNVYYSLDVHCGYKMRPDELLFENLYEFSLFKPELSSQTYDIKPLLKQIGDFYYKLRLEEVLKNIKERIYQRQFFRVYGRVPRSVDKKWISPEHLATLFSDETLNDDQVDQIGIERWLLLRLDDEDISQYYYFLPD